MEKNRRRANRRFHTDRMFKHAYHVIKHSWFWSPEDKSNREDWIKLMANRRRDNMQICSCSGCGNPRHGMWSGRTERLTMAELRAEDSFEDQIEEYYVTLEHPENDK